MSRSLKTKVFCAAATALAFSLAGCSLLPKEEAALKPPLVKPAQENYRTVKVEKGTIIKRISGMGTLESTSSDLAQFTGQGGRIAEITVKSGDRVKKGDVLVKLIHDGLDLQLKEQELALARAKLAYKQAKGAGDDMLRIASLQQEIEQMKYDRLKAQYDSKQLVSRIDGQVVFTESLKEGDFIEPYQTLVIVADPTRLRVSLRVENQSDVRDAEIGMTAEIGIKGTKMEGKVVQTPSSAPLTLNKDLAERYAKTLYIEIPKVPEGAEIGNSAEVSIVTQKKDNVLMIPKSGLRSYLGRTFVRVLEDGKRIREIDVEQGIASSTAVEIVNGLEEGQDVILQ